MKNKHKTNHRNALVAGLAMVALTLPVIGSAQIVQTVNDGGTGWNSSLWGSPAASPTSGNDYMTASGFFSASATRLGTPGVTGRIRGIASQGTFGGNFLEIVPNTELLLKDAGTYSADITLNGGVVRWSPNSAGNATLAGTINVASDSVLGSVQSGAQIFTIASAITGSSTLRLAGGTGANQTIAFDDGSGSSLNGFAGTLDIGGGQDNSGNPNLVTVNFNQAYDMSLAGITMGDYLTADVLNLGANITVGSFSFNGSSLGGGTYDVATLNSDFGSGSQFTGTGTLTIAAVPEPGSMALAALGGGLALLLVRRRNRKH